MDARFIVVFDADAVRDLESLKGRQERNAGYAVIDKLRMLGPDLGPPACEVAQGRGGTAGTAAMPRKLARAADLPQDREGVHDPGFCAIGVDVFDGVDALITPRLSSSR
jgi:hypothetical protein